MLSRMSEKPLEVINVRPCRGGWEAYESDHIRPFFAAQKEAIDYAMMRAAGRYMEIHVTDATGYVLRVLRRESAN
jgi:hypothetical protein